MASLRKTQDIVVLAHQLVTHPATVMNSPYDVSTALWAKIYCYHGFVEAAANTNPGTFLIQTSPSSSGDEDWATEFPFTATTGTPDDEILTAIELAGETSMGVAVTAGFVATDGVYLHDIDTLANSEWGRLREVVTNTSLDLIRGVTNTKPTAGSGCKAYNDAEIFVAPLDLSAIARVQVIFQHEGAVGADVHVKALMVLCDSIG